MFEQIRSNKRKTVFIVLCMAFFLFITGYVLAEAQHPGAGPVGLLIAFVIWLVMLLVSFFAGDSVFLAVSGAKQIQQADNPMLFNIVEEMKIASGLKFMPRVFIIDSPAPNAFATGRSPQKASVAVTTGLLERLNRSELQGVIAHELGHINNRDILYMLVVSAMMGAIVLLADVGVRSMFFGRHRSRSSSSSGGGQLQLVMVVIALVLMILAPLIAQLIYFALSRRREYLADASAALYTRYPEGLANALEKIATNASPLQGASKATAPMYIVNPLAISGNTLKDATSTHPPISARVAILRRMAGLSATSGLVTYKAYDAAFKQVTNTNKGVLPGMSLLGDNGVPLMAVSQGEQPHIDRRREATDTLWKVNDYIFVDCPCETKLKIPPVYRGQKITCPHCQTEHHIPLQ